MNLNVKTRSSLLTSLANFASAQLAAARMYSHTKTLNPDVLIALIGKEFDCQKIQCVCCYGGKGEDDANDEVMAVSPNSLKWKDGKDPTKKPHGTCWNCGEISHYSNKCLRMRVEKAKESPKKPEKFRGSANAAVKKNVNFKSDGAWVAVDSDDESITSFWDDIPTTDNGWFSNDDEGCSPCDLPDKLFVATEPSKCNEYSYVQAKLYDSGCTRHIEMTSSTLKKYLLGNFWLPTIIPSVL